MINSYSDAMRFLLEFIDYEKVTKYKYNIATFNLSRVDSLMTSIGRPHRSFRSAHVAGTKGKGSTSGLIQSILTACGFSAGLYTSPHLTRIEERMTVDGALMSQEDFVSVIKALHPYTEQARRERPNESPTYFELVTAAGFLHFARKKVDYAAVEVGMGGRLDATNVITPEACCITRIDYDHVERLGHTLDKIAWEKAGIIKPGVPVVVAPQEKEAADKIAAVAAERSAPMIKVGQDVLLSGIRTWLDDSGTPVCEFNLQTPLATYRALRLRMLGAHQAINAACAIAVVEVLSQKAGFHLAEDNIRRGIANAACPARLEVFQGNPPLVLDGAHNVASINALCDMLDSVFHGRKITLVAGFSRDKDATSMMKLLLPRAAKVIFTRSDSPRAADPAELAQMAAECCNISAQTSDDPFQALETARADTAPGGLVLVTGSFFLAGLLRPKLVAERQK